METAIMIGCIVMTMLLATAYFLVISGSRKEKKENNMEQKIDQSAIMIPNFNSSRAVEMEEERGEREREEAETEYISPHPIYAEPEVDLGKLELYLENAKYKDIPRCIRMISGMYISQYANLGFMEELIKKLDPQKSESVLDAIEMGRNPELYMERHKECDAGCSNSKCPFHVKRGNETQDKLSSTAIAIGLVMFTGQAFAIGNGMNGITQATSEVTSYFAPITKLIYAIGAIVGLIGAVRVYSKFSSGDPDTTKVAATWFGACIFLVIAATVLSGFFF